ncbi:MAG: bifunctional diaminohydroxyphosphoribosylaminopyrimidine deaminase/5-amino-6-(5-phosphoribosylamino)uracil reductase RibD [Chitinophagaceae bacterium]
MYRCLQLAALGMGNVAPNPVVGAVLVYHGRIIGEGYHQQYGQAHAEVNCIASVKEEERHLISQSTLYVSLEPCAHHGKTPPCADLIIQHKIPKVVVGHSDPFVAVAGKGIEKLKRAGVEVIVDVLKNECWNLNKRFFTFHTKHRPYITLKWAQTADGKIAQADNSRLHISNEYTNRLVHKWRSEETAILIGTNTALFDDPELNTRLWKGNNPVRLVVDKHLRLPQSLKLFQSSQTTIVFNLLQNTIDDLKGVTANSGVLYYQLSEDASLIHQIVHAVYQMNIQSVLVEGGAKLLQSFIDEGLWDEARVITNTKMFAGNGINSPSLPALSSKEEMIANDRVTYFFNEFA